MNQEQPQLLLPSTLITRIDLARLVREIESLDSDLESQKVKSRGQAAYQLPPMSSGFTDFITLNKFDIANDQQRVALKTTLSKLKDSAPIMHLTLATEADPQSLGQLVAWIRQEVHPLALLSVGLQPALIGGVYVRTPNHIHDFSMRAMFEKQTGVLMKALEELK